MLPVGKWRTRIHPFAKDVLAMAIFIPAGLWAARRGIELLATPNSAFDRAEATFYVLFAIGDGVAVALLLAWWWLNDHRKPNDPPKADAELFAATENITHHALFSLDASGAVATWNKGGRRLFGYAADAIVGKNIDVLLADQTKAPRWTQDALALSLALGRYEAPQSLRRLDGAFFEAEVTIVAILGPKGAHQGHAVIVHDITDRLTAEAQIHRMERIDAIGHVTAGVAHDYNNLLQAQIVGMQLLQDEVEEGSVARELADIVLHSADQAAHLTGQLLALSRQDVLQAERLDPKTIMRDVLALARLANGMVALAPGSDGEGAPAVVADKMQLEAALLNLIVNAVDAAGRKSAVTLGISVSSADMPPPSGMTGEGSKVAFWVEDTGPGMTPEVAARACEPFFTTKGAKGSGLGLSMVRNFARHFGGDVVIHSVLGEGTRIEIWLPAAAEFLNPTTKRSG